MGFDVCRERATGLMMFMERSIQSPCSAPYLLRIEAALCRQRLFVYTTFGTLVSEFVADNSTYNMLGRWNRLEQKAH